MSNVYDIFTDSKLDLPQVEPVNISEMSVYEIILRARHAAEASRNADRIRTSYIMREWLP